MKRFGDNLMQEALTFDDCLLVPQHSTVLPDQASTETSITKLIKISVPLVSAAMDTVSEANLAIALARAGGVAIIHRANTPEEQTDQVRTVKKENLLVGAAVGVGEDSLTRVESLVNTGVDFIAVDTAHGHSQKVIDKVAEIKSKHPNIQLIAGNIVTASAAEALIKAGADGLKVGVGPGSICTTRIVAGVGVPQLTAIISVSEVAKKHGIPVIADGGIRYSGDIVKALAAGASAVMLGSLFAGTNEAPGETFESNGKIYKHYRGMGSIGAMLKNGGDRYFQKAQSDEKKIISEGVEGAVLSKGSIADTVYQLVGGIKSGFGYVGAKDIKDLWEKAEFVKVSKASVVESHPHDIMLIKEPPNYFKK